MKILILGTGLLGSEFLHYPKQRFEDAVEIVSWGIKELDITDEQQVHTKIKTLAPDVVINCTGYTAVDKAEQEQELAMRVNGQAVEHLVEACNAINATLVHYSTDYVFDGSQQSGYVEDDVPAQNPLNVYGRSKLQGEQYVIQNAHKFYLVRISWLFGKYGNNFIETVLRLAREKEKITIVDNEFGRPTSATDVVAITISLLQQNLPFGIYHATSEGKPVSWYEYARFVLQHKNKDALQKLFPITSKQYNAPATRPQHCVLLNTKISKNREWRDAVKEYWEQ